MAALLRQLAAAVRALGSVVPTSAPRARLHIEDAAALLDIAAHDIEVSER